MNGLAWELTKTERKIKSLKTELAEVKSRARELKALLNIIYREYENVHFDNDRFHGLDDLFMAIEQTRPYVREVSE